MHVEVEVCKECPVLDANGAPTGLYHLAGEFCPREPIEGVVEEPTVITISVLDLVREDVGGRTARDSAYLKSHLEALGPCTTHTELIEPIPAVYDPNLFSIGDPATWPTQEQWPGFDPADPLTWPLPPVEPPVETSPGSDPGYIDPVMTPPAVTPTPVPTSTPVPFTDSPPPQSMEPYIPVDLPEAQP